MTHATFLRPRCPNNHRAKRIRVRVWHAKKGRSVYKKMWGCRRCGATLMVAQ